MKVQDIHFQGADNLKLFAQIWEPETTIKALAVITHGHGEHSGRYIHVGESLASRGIAVVALDLRGHGRSEGPRGLVMDWAEIREDLRLLIDEARTRFLEMPLFLYGHSVGGAICLDYAIRNQNQFKGVIASAPTLGQPNIPAVLFAISKVLSRIYPKFSMATQLEVNALSRDEAVVRAYQEDPLVHNIGTARFGTELLKTADWIQEHAEDLHIPLLLIHGAQDRLSRPADSKRFFPNVGSKDKTFMDLPDGFHEPHNDLDKDVVILRIGDWILEHS